MNVKARRPYDSTRRREQALGTRQAVLDAALALFVADGYAATPIHAIAARAGVSPETVYASFGTKRNVLARLVDQAIAGGAAAGPVLEQEWVGTMRAEPDPRRRLRILASRGTAILARRAVVDEIVRGAAAADSEVAALWAKGKEDRYAGQRALLQIVVGDAVMRPGQSLDRAADAIFAIGSPETYLALTADRGWTADEFERWYAETIERVLFAAE